MFNTHQREKHDSSLTKNRGRIREKLKREVLANFFSPSSIYNDTEVVGFNIWRVFVEGSKMKIIKVVEIEVEGERNRTDKFWF